MHTFELVVSFDEDGRVGIAELLSAIQEVEPDSNEWKFAILTPDSEDFPSESILVSDRTNNSFGVLIDPTRASDQWLPGVMGDASGFYLFAGPIDDISRQISAFAEYGLDKSYRALLLGRTDPDVGFKSIQLNNYEQALISENCPLIVQTVIGFNEEARAIGISLEGQPIIVY